MSRRYELTSSSSSELESPPSVLPDSARFSALSRGELRNFRVRADEPAPQKGADQGFSTENRLTEVKNLRKPAERRRGSRRDR